MATNPTITKQRIRHRLRKAGYRIESNPARGTIALVELDRYRVCRLGNNWADAEAWAVELSD